MKKIILFACAVISAATMSSCSSSYRMTGQSAPMAYTNIKPDQIKANFEFNLKEKRVGEARSTYLLGIFRLRGDDKYSDVKGLNIVTGPDATSLSGLLVFTFNLFGLSKMEKVKSAAVFNALKASDADLLVNPQFETQKNGYFFGFIQIYRAKVKTYDAKIISLYQEKDDQQIDISIAAKNISSALTSASSTLPNTSPALPSEVSTSVNTSSVSPSESSTPTTSASPSKSSTSTSRSSTSKSSTSTSRRR